MNKIAAISAHNKKYATTAGPRCTTIKSSKTENDGTADSTASLSLMIVRERMAAKMRNMLIKIAIESVVECESSAARENPLASKSACVAARK